MKVYIVMLATSLISPAALAGGFTVHWGVAAGALYSDYREYATDGHRLDREHGLLPGISLYTSGQWQGAFWRWCVSAHKATLDYKGQTQHGHPLSTNSSALFLATSLNAGYWLDADSHWGVYGHLAGHWWKRDVHASGTVQGLAERYRWMEAGAGLRYVYRRAGDKQGWGQAARLAAFATVASSVKVYLSGIQGAGLQDVRVHSADSFGLRLQYSATHIIGHGLQLQLQPRLAYWRFERSQTRHGITEPRSDTWRLGLRVGVRY